MQCDAMVGQGSTGLEAILMTTCRKTFDKKTSARELQAQAHGKRKSEKTHKSDIHHDPRTSTLTALQERGDMLKGMSSLAGVRSMSRVELRDSPKL